MALHVDLEALLQSMSPEDAAAQRTLFEKQPKLAEGYLRQADYDRFMNKAKTEIQTASERAKKWEEWGKVNKPRHDSLLTDYEKAQEELKAERAKYTELQQKVASAATNAGGGDMTEAEKQQLELNILKAIGEKGYVTNSDISRIASEEAGKLVKGVADDFLTKTWPSALETQNEIMEISFDHQAEFGKPLRREDRVKIAQLMKDEGLTSVKSAYDRFTQADREEKKIAAAVEERLKAQRDEAAKHNIPGVTSSGVEAGHMQLRMTTQAQQKTNNGGLPTGDYEIGDNTAAMAAAAELRAEGKA